MSPSLRNGLRRGDDNAASGSPERYVSGMSPRAPPPPSPFIKIDVFADIVCPWCFIGTRRLLKVLADTPSVKTEVVYRAFLLDPSTPPEGADLRERLKAKYGGDPDQMFGRVEEAARQTGIPLDFSKVRRTVSTVKAHTLLRHAADRDTQLPLADALYGAYFLEGRDIGQDDVLVELAAQHGFSAQEARELLLDSDELALTAEEARQASEAGIQGVPFFIFDGKFAISGAQPEQSFHTALSEATAARAS